MDDRRRRLQRWTVDGPACRAKRGEEWTDAEIEEAWAWVMREGYQQRLETWTYWKIRHFEDARDIVSEQLRRFFQNRSRLKKYDPFKYRGNDCPLLNWLTLLVRQAVWDWYRGRKTAALTRVDESIESMSRDSWEIEKVDCDLDWREKVKRLNQGEQGLVRLRLLGLTHQEIAERTGRCSAEAVKQAMSRIRNKLTDDSDGGKEYNHDA